MQISNPKCDPSKTLISNHSEHPSKIQHLFTFFWEPMQKSGSKIYNFLAMNPSVCPEEDASPSPTSGQTAKEK